MRLFVCDSSKHWLPGRTGVASTFGPRLLTSVLVLMLSSACTGGARPKNVPFADLPATPAAVLATATPSPSASIAARQSSALVTNSGINLGAPANPRPQEQGAEPDLQQFQTKIGTRVLVPSTWETQSPVSLSQKVCADDRCVTIDETLQLFVSIGGENALGVMSMTLPADAPSGASSLLPAAVRGSISALSAAGANPDIIEAPAPATVSNASRSLLARARIVDPTSGETETVTVLAAARDREIDTLLIGVSDIYQRQHRDSLDRIRSSFALTGPVQ
jgi:hypothetical protein